MMTSIFARVMRSAAVLVLGGAALLANPAKAEFVGGGALHGFVGCEAQGWSGTVPVRGRFRPAELLGNPTSVTAFPPHGGAISLMLWHSLGQRSTWVRGRGESVWGRTYVWGQRPRVRMLQRVVTDPPGGSINDAMELTIRMRVRNFNDLPGCQADLSMILYRAG
ncbi:MAG: hypothetical protein Kow0013_29380 [Pararhodobacter sp.]